LYIRYVERVTKGNETYISIILLIISTLLRLIQKQASWRSWFRMGILLGKNTNKTEQYIEHLPNLYIYTCMHA